MGHHLQLLRYLTLGYAALVAYACLYPFSGWLEPGQPWLDFLSHAPHYWLVREVVANVAGFIPLGFLLAASLHPPLPRPGAILVAAVMVSLFSLGLETLQNLLPARVPSLYDWGANTLGGMLGSWLGVHGSQLFAHHGLLARWRGQAVVGHAAGDIGLLLGGLWLLAQCQPEPLLMASGDLRPWLSLPARLPFTVPGYIRTEAALVATQVLGVGLFLRAVMPHQRWGGITVVVPWLLLGVLIDMASQWWRLAPGEQVSYLTPGARIGLGSGLAVLLVCLWLPPRLQRWLAILALLCAVLLTNLSPPNPFTLPPAGDGFLYLNPLTRITAALWPGLALLWLWWVREDTAAGITPAPPSL